MVHPKPGSLEISYRLLPVIQHGPRRKQWYTPSQEVWKEVIACFPRYNTDRIENNAFRISVARIFVAARTVLSSHCLVTVMVTLRLTDTDERDLGSTPLR
jgi:hypothetical protein